MTKFGSLALAVDKPQKMVLIHPSNGQPICDEDGNKAYIELLSFDSAAARAYDIEIANRRLQNTTRKALTAEELDAEEIGKLVCLTKNWLLIQPDKTVLNVECTPENAKELYSANSTAWIAEQALAFMRTRKNFA